MQAVEMRFGNSKQCRRVGGSETDRFGGRMISATNQWIGCRRY
jgi:DNA-binding NtrC family response regulator